MANAGELEITLKITDQTAKTCANIIELYAKQENKEIISSNGKIEFWSEEDFREHGFNK